MLHYIALTLPNGGQVQPPAGIPSGGVETLQKAMGGGITIMIILAALLSLIFLVWGGMQWTSSGGDKGKVAAARSKITYAIIGLVVALCAFLIVNILGAFFNVKLFS